MALPTLSPEQLIKPRFFEGRVALMYAALFIPVGVHLPYFPVWLQSIGFNPEQIALMLAAPMLLRVVTTPLVTAFADRASDRANVMIAMTAAALVVSFGYYLEPSFGVIMAVSLLLLALWTPHALLTDSIALSGVRRFGSSYSNMRIWGSAAFLMANIGGGWIIAATTEAAVPVMITCGLVFALFAALMLPRLGRPRFGSPVSAADLRKSGRSYLTRYFVLCVAAAGVINASHGFMYGFASIYWKSIGLGDEVIGALWAAAVAAEVCLLLVFRRLMGNLSAPTLLAMAGVVCVIRWILFPVVWELGLGVYGFFFTQALHAFSTGLTLLGVPKLVAEAIGEEHLGAAQGVAFFANGLSMALVTLASGAIYEQLGSNGFFTMVAVALVGLALLIPATWQRSRY